MSDAPPKLPPQLVIGFPTVEVHPHYRAELSCDLFDVVRIDAVHTLCRGFRVHEIRNGSTIIWPPYGGYHVPSVAFHPKLPPLDLGNENARTVRHGSKLTMQVENATSRPQLFEAWALGVRIPDDREPKL